MTGFFNSLIQNISDIKVILFVVIFVLTTITIFLLIKFLKIRIRYKDFIDRDKEIQKLNTEIKELSKKQTTFEKEYNDRVKELNGEYVKYKEIYDNLKKELSITEENLDAQSFGVYKPHFDFKTSEEYKAKLEKNYERQKSLIKNEGAVKYPTSWTINGSLSEGKKMTKHYAKLILRAFNGECDATIFKVKWNNVNVMQERIRKAFEAINKMGTEWKIYITDNYLDVKLEELHLYYEMEQKLYEEKEEQRHIQEQMREEEKAQREFERARKEAEAEESDYQKSLAKMKVELEKAKGAEINELNEKIKDLELQLAQAKEKKERAISMAQLTKQGNVYIISNIGSFGESVFKIGMTRREDPYGRVRELGDASVPFGFDVHAMIYSEDAPTLELKLHSFFEKKRINLVNERKEFFNVTIEELEEFAKSNNLPITITKLAEAKEYRETLALRQQNDLQQVATPEPSPFPKVLVGIH
jgi:hypothetical protein